MVDNLGMAQKAEYGFASYKQEIWYGALGAVYVGLMFGMLFYHSMIFTQSKDIDYSAYRLESLNMPYATE